MHHSTFTTETDQFSSSPVSVWDRHSSFSHFLSYFVFVEHINRSLYNTCDGFSTTLNTREKFLAKLIQLVPMATSLTGVGLVWAFLSLTAALLCCSGFYLPFWIQGRLMGKVDAYFSSFRRCNYPRVSAQGVVEIVQECGRYSRFWDIPSAWWQASTVLVGAASGLSLLVAVTALAACCITYVIHTGTAKVAGALQLLAALLVCGGGATYPAGWDNREVRDCCGNASHVYKLGTCQLSWSVYLLSSAVVLLIVCFALSFCASRITPGCFRI